MQCASPVAFALRALATDAARKTRGMGLAARVLMVTIGCVLVAIGLVYVTRLSAIRETWLHNKLVAAETAADVFDIGGPDKLPADLSRKILSSVGAQSISIGKPAERRIHGPSSATPNSIETVTLDGGTFPEGVVAAFRTLFASPGTMIRIADAKSAGDKRTTTSRSSSTKPR